MEDGIPVTECFCHTPNEALGPFGGRVDSDEPERSFRRSHFFKKKSELKSTSAVLSGVSGL